MKERIDVTQRQEKLPRTAPYRGCPECLRPVDWQYTAHDLEPGVFGLGVPLCPVHGKQRGWVVVEGEALQGEFLTGGFVADTKEWAGCR